MTYLFYLFCAIIVGLSSYHCYKLNYASNNVDEKFHFIRVIIFLVAVIVISIVGAFETLNAFWLIPGYCFAVAVVTMFTVVSIKRK